MNPNVLAWALFFIVVCGILYRYLYRSAGQLRDKVEQPSAPLMAVSPSAAQTRADATSQARTPIAPQTTPESSQPATATMQPTTSLRTAEAAVIATREVGPQVLHPDIAATLPPGTRTRVVASAQPKPFPPAPAPHFNGPRADVRATLPPTPSDGTLGNGDSCS